MSTAQRIKLPDGSIVNLPGGGYELVASVKTEEEVSRIALSGFEANELLILMSLKKVGTESFVPVLTLNGKWTAGNAYLNINSSLPNSFFQSFCVNVYAKDGNAMINVLNNNATNIVYGNHNYEKATSIEIEKTGTPNYAVGCEVYVYAR